MKATILGLGRMGSTIAWAMTRLGFDVHGIDANPKAAVNMPDGNKNFLIAESQQEILHKIKIDYHNQPDIVISSLPYHQTEAIGHLCIEAGLRYCDLGGRVDISERLNSHAKNSAVLPIFTDLGLAPGWVNILAEEGYRQLSKTGEISNVEMMVGGLPNYLESASNPLRYKITWSVDGLINEYKDDCLILKDGEIISVKGMDGLELIKTENLGTLEAFYTSGGASHSIKSMAERGVKNCSYRTLRFQGHRNIVKFLIRDCKLADRDLNQIFVNGCGYADKDEVIIIARVTNGNKAWEEEKLIKSDDKFSAMQKSTAFPISSVAALMAEGVFDKAKNLKYSDIPFDKFNEKLDILFSGRP